MLLSTQWPRRRFLSVLVASRGCAAVTRSDGLAGSSRDQGLRWRLSCPVDLVVPIDKGVCAIVDERAHSFSGSLLGAPHKRWEVS
jgi:hypothetical protein